MPALSFQPEWLNKLLNSTKQQTTRQQTDRIKPGDTCHIYNQQRGRIADKSVRKLTADGIATMPMNRYPFPKPGMHYAHFLGKVRIAEVYDIHPCEMTEEELEVWARADGFKDFHPTYRIFTKGIHEDDGANMWFQRRYGDGWMRQWWTVIQWDGWLERYFEPEVSG
jgi:hypothetical protein